VFFIKKAIIKMLLLIIMMNIIGNAYTVKMNMLYLIKRIVATDYKQYY